LLLPVVVAVVQVAGASLAGAHQPEARHMDVLGILFLCGSAVSLVWMRGRPVAALFGALGSTLAYWLLGYPRGPVFIALAIAFVNAVMRGNRRAGIGALALGYTGFVWAPYLLGGEPAPQLAAALGVAAWLLVLLTASEVARGRRERALEATRMRTEEAKRKEGEERMRIARELHDVLAHNISLINVQAGVALHLMDERPEQARSALTAIKEASEETLREVRSVLDILRAGDSGAPRSPAPSLADLHDLLDRTESAGLHIDRNVVGRIRPLPRGVGLAAFRVVQEALTNVTRHSGADRAAVTLVYGDRDLIVEVEDEGNGSVSPSATGSGIAGMRERTVSLGGEFEAGPGPQGGFRVRARIPVPPEGGPE
jgi:signal transduction histidine kinase